MFIRRINKKYNGKVHTTTYLAESYRDKDGKVRHRHISNISKWPEPMIKSFQKLLKGEKIVTLADLDFSQGGSFGAIQVISEVAKRIGISRALGYSRQAKLALIQIAGRIITQGSRHYLAKEWQQHQAIEKVFKVNNFTHNDLYENLSWLAENQLKIEQKIFNFRSKEKSIKQIFLYDVTSSYLEGEHNELAAYGYNRDKKKGKKQIVIGLMTDEKGYPITVETFKGNTSDTKTVSNQLIKLKNTFSVERVIFVGDKGMIKTAQIDELTNEEYKWDYLTSITKKEINSLLDKNIIQLELFEDELVEIEQEGIRYILRRNPVRKQEIRNNRADKIKKITNLIEQQNQYLSEHKKAKADVALRRVTEKISALKLTKIISCNLLDRTLSYQIDEEALQKAEKLDGCYVIKTNVAKQYLDKQTAHSRYKDLAQVEYAFRTLKTTLENIRPVYVRTKENTKGHVFVASLAYMIIKYISDATTELGYSKKFIFETLDKINYLQYTYEDRKIEIIPELLAAQTKISEKLNIKLK